MASVSGDTVWLPITHLRLQDLPPKNGHQGGNVPRPTSSIERGPFSAGPDATRLATVLTKRYRNAAACAVFKLPPELLSHMFSISVLCDRPGAKNGMYNLGWISVTQVCHRWREVALATPSLWRHLDFACMSRKWCSEMLRRSGRCPLEVTLRVTGCSGLYPVTTSLDVARELVRPEYSARLASLRLDLSSLAKSEVESLVLSLQRSASSLESLELRQTSWEPMTVGSLASCLPSFRRLALQNVFLSPWISPIFVNLHELHISFDRHRLLHLQDTLPSYDEIATILGRMPELRCLSLRNVFAEGTLASSERLAGCQCTISLPKLQRLSLIDQQECDLLSFSSLLRLPSTTCAEIKTNGRVWKGISSPASLFSHYERTFGPVRRLKLLANGRHPQVTLEFRTSDAPSVDRSAPSQLRLQYTPSLLPTPPPHPRGSADGESQPPTPPPPPLPLPTPHQIAHHFGDACLCLDGLLHLEIVSHAAAASPASSDGWWAALFSHATRLQQIRATYRGAVDGFIEVLLAQCEQQQQRQQQGHPQHRHSLFPDLRTVTLSLVDLDETVAPPARTRGDLLLDGLVRRRELGIGIRTLEVPDLDGRWVRKLREIVPDVAHADI